MLPTNLSRLSNSPPAADERPAWQRLLQSKSLRYGFVVSVAAHLLVGLVLAFLVIVERAIDQFEVVYSILETNEPVAFDTPLDTSLDLPLSNELDTEFKPQFMTEHLSVGGAPGLDTVTVSGLGAVGASSGGGLGDGTGDGIGSGLGAEIDKAVGGRGGALSRNLRASLMWKNRNDIDLRMQFIGAGGKGNTSRKETVSYNEMKTASGFELDVDSNVEPPLHNPGVENIVLAKGPPPDGHYVIDMHYFSNHDPEPLLTECQLYFVAGRVERLVYAKFQRFDQRIILLSFDVKQGEVVNLKQGPGTTAAPKPRPKNEVEAERLLAQAMQCMEDATQSGVSLGREKRAEARELLKQITSEFGSTAAAKEARKLSKRWFKE